MRTNTIHQISHNLQKIDKGPIKLKKWDQSNEPSFCLLARLQTTKNKH